MLSQWRANPDQVHTAKGLSTKELEQVNPICMGQSTVTYRRPKRRSDYADFEMPVHLRFSRFIWVCRAIAFASWTMHDRQTRDIAHQVPERTGR